MPQRARLRSGASLRSAPGTRRCDHASNRVMKFHAAPHKSKRSSSSSPPAHRESGGRRGDVSAASAESSLLSTLPCGKMTPTSVLSCAEVRVVTGSSGRGTIPSTTLWRVLDGLKSGWSPGSAQVRRSTGRGVIPHIPIGFRLEGDSRPEPTRLALSVMGPTWMIPGHLGTANAIVVDLTFGARFRAQPPAGARDPGLPAKWQDGIDSPGLSHAECESARSAEHPGLPRSLAHGDLYLSGTSFFGCKRRGPRHRS